MILDRRTTLFLLALLAVLTFIPVLHSGYTTTDDIYFAQGISEGWRMPWLFDARNSGRLQHVVDGRLMAIAYGWGNYWLGKAVAFATILSNVMALVWLLRVMTGDVRLGVLAAVFFFAFISNTWDHNLLTAYPFILSLFLTLLLCSLTQWWLFLERSQTAAPLPRGAWSPSRLKRWSLALFGLSLFSYESFIFYGLLFPAMTLAFATGTWPQRIRRAIRTPHVLVLVGFLVAVVLFRKFLYTEEGRAFSAANEYEVNISPRAILKVLERYGLSALPMHYFRVYRDLINDFYLGYGSFRTRLLEIFRVFEAAWLVKAAIVAFLAGSLMASRTFVRRRGLLLLFAFVFMVLTNVPVAIIAKYQGWVMRSYSHAYLTSYFVFCGVVVLFAVVLDSFVGVASRIRPWVGAAAAWLVAIAAFTASYGTDFVNAHVAASQQQMYDRGKAVDAWVASPTFRAMPAGSVVLAPTLWDKYPGATHLYDEYWSRYVLWHAYREIYVGVLPQNRLNIIHVLTDETRPVIQAAQAANRLYYLKVVREARSDLTYSIFGRVTGVGEGDTLAADDLTLMTHARSDHFRVFGRVYGVTAGCRARVFVDGVPSRGTFDGPFGVHVDHHRRPEAWVSARLTTKAGVMDPETVLVSESAETVDGAVDVRFGPGFYPDEVAHRWAESQATLTLLNRTDRAAQVDLQFELRAPWAPVGSSHHVLVKTGGREFDWPIGTEFRKHVIRLDVAPRAAVDVTFSTTAPRIDPAADGRNLVLMFLPSLRAQEVGCEVSASTE